MQTVIKEFTELANIYMDLTTRTEKVKRIYNGIELYPSEIHTLVFINEHQDLNLTTIAQNLGVTKGAIFKIIEKLVKKDLLEKYKVRENNKNTYFKITKKGKIACDGHTSFHQQFFDQPEKDFVNFVEQNEKTLLQFFDFSKEYLKMHLEKIENKEEK